MEKLQEKMEKLQEKENNCLSAFRKIENSEFFDLGNKSWVVLIPNFLPSEKEIFEETWNIHPQEFNSIKMFGKDILIPRWQQSYGFSYKYSGNISKSIEPTPLISNLLEKMNKIISGSDYVFNMCLCNWYSPEHYIGPHSDDIRQLVIDSPIAGISWGCERIFVITSKNSKEKLKIKLNDGDLIVMGGKCQENYKHEITKLKRGEKRGNRINFTFRCFKTFE